MPRLLWTKVGGARWVAHYTTGERSVLEIWRTAAGYELMDASEGTWLLGYGPYRTLVAGKRAVAQLV